MEQKLNSTHIAQKDRTDPLASNLLASPARGTAPVAIAKDQPKVRGFSDNPLTPFPHQQIYHNTEKPEPRYAQSPVVSQQPLASAPPSYTPWLASPPDPRATTLFAPHDTRLPSPSLSGHAFNPHTITGQQPEQQTQSTLSRNWRDAPVPPLTVADDPGRDNGGDDRRHERPQSHGERRVDPPPPYNTDQTAPSQTAPYPSYWGSGPPVGAGPYDRQLSPPRMYPFPPPSLLPSYPAGFPPPSSQFAPPLPSPFPPQPYAHMLPPYDYSQSSSNPPHLPSMPFPIPHSGGLRPPPDIPGVLPPAPLPGLPPNPKFILPPGTETEFKLVVRQQPERARMCGFGEKDRRPIDPPPIVELLETNGPITPKQRQDLVLQCTLWNEDGTEHRNIIRTTTGATAGLGAAEELPIQPEEKHARVMMGNIFANATLLEDDKGRRGLFYIFPDLSIRVEGRYRLKFDLLRLVLPPDQPTGDNHRIAAESLSDVFVVYAAKKFPGMMESTELTKAIARQGIKISVRGEPRGRREGKGNTGKRGGAAGKRRGSISSDGDDDEVASSKSSETKRKRSAE